MGADRSADDNRPGMRERTRPVRRLWSLYSWWDRLGNLWALVKGSTAAPMIIGSGAVVVAVTGMTLNDAYRSYQRAVSLPPAATVRETPNSNVFVITGRDRAGRWARFDVVVLKKEFVWVRGSDRELEQTGRRIPADELARSVLDEEMLAALGAARAIIAVGTASQEGDPVEERARAGRRAVRTAELAAHAVGAGIPISTLNLGQYHAPCESCETAGTSWQRPFIVIAVTAAAPGVVLAEALADAMTGREQLPAPTSYSEYQLERWR